MRGNLFNIGVVSSSVGTGGVTPVLDLVSGAESAGSLRLLRTAYTGHVVELQRAGGLEVSRFFANDGDTLENSLINASGDNPQEWLLSIGQPANTGLRIRTLYNQSTGGGSNLVQTNVGLQPHIYAPGGTDYYKIGNRIAIHWDATDDALVSTAWPGHTNVSCFIVQELLSTENAHLLIQGINSNFFRIVSETGSGSNNVAGTVHVNGVATGSTTRGQLYADIQGVFNGAAVGPITTQYIDFDLSGAGFVSWHLNKYGAGSNFSNECKIAEVLIYPSDMTADIATIKDNQRAYYGI